ncbi:unnamed protein product [Sympodiomycopsis kandeliae]
MLRRTAGHQKEDKKADGLDEKDVRPGAVVVRKGVTAQDVNSSRGFDLAHVPIESKTTTGSGPQGQIGGYSTAFRPFASRYQVAASVRCLNLTEKDCSFVPRPNLCSDNRHRLSELDLL